MATWTLTFGTYADPSFVGIKGVLHRSAPLVDGAGAVSQQTWTVVIANDGTGTLTGLPFNDDGSTYYLEWQLLAWKDSPRNKTFQVLSSSGVTIVDYDGLPSAPTTTVTPAGVPFVSSVNGHTGSVTLAASDVGADAAGAAAAAQAAATAAAATDASSRVAAEVARADGKYVAAARLDAATAPLVTGNGTTAGALRAAFVSPLPTVGSLTYNGDGTIASDPDGNTYTWNTDGTPATQTKGGVTRTFHWNTDGTLASVS